MAKKKKNILNLQKEDVAFIMGKSFKYFKAIINGTYCNKCKSTHTSKIIGFEIYLDISNDVIVDGCCDKCQFPIHRRIETSEKMEASERAQITRMVKVDLLGQ